MWEIQHGNDYKKHFEIAKKHNIKLPESMINMPTLPHYLLWIKEAFISLSTCRQIGFGVGQIPWTALKQYTDHLELSYEEFLYFEKMIYGIDNAYVDYVNKDKDKDGSNS